MDRLRFGTFLAPHHPLGESPTLLFRRDLDLVEHLDRLGYDEFWCGEHHSSGWEMIASPEMFLAAAGERTATIKLGTGVVSLPYHHPFQVAQRIVQLDHMTRGRAMFGSGPGALPSDARTMGVDPILQRDRQDESLGVIRRLLSGEDRFTYESDWFTLRDAALQLLPVQRDMPMTVASSISPSGMQLAGKYGIGVLSIASNSTAGLQALPTQWGLAEESAATHGQQVDRAAWRVLMAWHIAEDKEQARREAVDGLHRWHNEYNVHVLGRPGAVRVESAWELLEQVAEQGSNGAGAAVIAGNLIAFVACVPFALPPSGGGTDWALLIYLGVVQIALAYLMLTAAVRSVAAFEVSLLLLVEPALNPVWSWLFLGETPGPVTIAGGVLILGATAVKVWADARRGTETAVEEAARAAPP